MGLNVSETKSWFKTWIQRFKYYILQMNSELCMYPVLNSFFTSFYIKLIMLNYIFKRKTVFYDKNLTYCIWYWKISMFRLGKLEYNRAYRVQEHLVKFLKSGVEKNISAPNFLILLQHTPVYTTGIRTKVDWTFFKTKIYHIYTKIDILLSL